MPCWHWWSPLVIGVTAGLVAGYYRGWFDSVSSWVAGLIMALPGIVLLLAARAVLGPSMWPSMAIFGVLLSPAFFRLIYAAVTAVRDELYVDAARVAGLSDARIIGRHILTVVRAPVIIQSAMVLGIAIAIQAGLEFLGLGDLSIPTWGACCRTVSPTSTPTRALVLWPRLVIALVCIALTLLANTMRDVLERSRGPASRAARPRPQRTADADGAAESAVPPPSSTRTTSGPHSSGMGEILLEVTRPVGRLRPARRRHQDRGARRRR